MEPGPGAMRAWGPSGGGRWGRVSSLPFLAALCLLTAPASATLGAGVQPAVNNSRWDLAEVLGVGCPGAHGGQADKHSANSTLSLTLGLETS